MQTAFSGVHRTWPPTLTAPPHKAETPAGGRDGTVESVPLPMATATLTPGSSVKRELGREAEAVAYDSML